jgi:NarL family two-component system response regulator LiaR
VIRVLIADDHAVVRQGLRTFLELQDAIEVVGEAADGEAAVAETERLKPDIALMDLVMPRLAGDEAIRRIAAVSPATRVVVLTSFAEDDKLFPAVRRRRLPAQGRAAARVGGRDPRRGRRRDDPPPHRRRAPPR